VTVVEFPSDAGIERPSGAGALAARVIEEAASLCETLARGAGRDWDEARGMAVQAVRLRERAAAAGPANAAAFQRARELLQRPPDPARTGRDAALRADLVAAADTLLEIAALGADCAALAAAVAVRGPAASSADAVGAAELAAAAARAVSGLVAVNLALAPDDAHRRRARAIVVAAEQECERARGSGAR
jgi:formiminotetrahydrofolate cyclodeaminase